VRDSGDLERKLRENRGRAAWPEFARALADVLPELGSDPPRIPIEATDAMRADFFNRVASDVYLDRRTWDASERDEVEALLQLSAAQHEAREYVLFHYLDRLTGAVLVEGAHVLDRAGPVWELVREDLCLVSHDLQHGLCLELNHHGRGEEIELTSWGALVPPQS
jgi:hypothetical protein